MTTLHRCVDAVLEVRGRRRWQVDAAAVLAVVVAAAGCDRRGDEIDAAARAATDVTTAAVASADLPEAYDAGGVVRARTTAAITSRLLAPVLEIRVAAGDYVHRGQVLVRLEGDDLDAQERRANASREAAEQGSRASAADRDAARAALALAIAHHARLALLHDRRSATDDELDQAVARLREAEARMLSAAARVAEAGAARSAASAAADAARVGASWAAITAPFDGVITETLIERGNMAAPGLPLLRMEQAGAMRVDVRLDESRAAGVVVGGAVEVLLDRGADSTGTDGPAVHNGPGTGGRVTGRVAEIARAAEAGAHAFLVKIDLPPDVRAHSGTFARARFPGPSHRGLVVPRAALVRRGQLTSVFVVDGDRARVRFVSAGDVEPGSLPGSMLEVLSGLDAGEHVIIDPVPGLQDSARVRIVSGRAARTRDQESS